MVSAIPNLLVDGGKNYGNLHGCLYSGDFFFLEQLYSGDWCLCIVTAKKGA